MNDKIPQNIKKLLNDIESKNCDAGQSKEGGEAERQIADLEIECLIESRAQEKSTIDKLEKILKKYPEFSDKVKTELAEAMNKVGKKIEEAVAIDKIKNHDEGITAIESESKKKINALRNEFAALKNIKDRFFKTSVETNEDEDEEE